MKIVFVTNYVSPHRLPFAKALVRMVGEENYRYVYTEEVPEERVAMGWPKEGPRAWCRKGTLEDRDVVDADVLIVGHHRDIGLFEKRNKAGKKTFYTSERWFSPPFGILRLLHPRYFRMAARFVRCLRDENFKVLPMGVHAARDFARLAGLFRGDVRCLFRAPKLTFEPKPGGKIRVDGKEIGWMRMWGYFVEPSSGGKNARRREGPLRVLWVGRMLNWKRVDTVVRACRNLDGVALDLYGKGPQEARLKKLAGKARSLAFHDFVPIGGVRELMREHDVYVLASNGREGWGAVVNEALEEGLPVLGTFEAGASATLLPEADLFHAGDWRGLKRLLSRPIFSVAGSEWNVSNALRALKGLLKESGVA